MLSDSMWSLLYAAPVALFQVNNAVEAACEHFVARQSGLAYHL